ncbi:MAG: fatty acid desaturase [Marinicaulis sp.]|nr:fatty acid desaturase [Marinicaulis sp.]
MTAAAPQIINGDNFPLAEARAIAKRFSRPKAIIYWVDFSISISIAWAAFYVAVVSPAFSLIQIGAILVASLAHYRAVIFTHELAHLKRGTFTVFRAVWNIFSGIPMMVPSFSYTGVHIDHHRPGIYGFKEDGEYVPFATGKPWRIIAYLLLIFVLPLLMAARFIVLAPLSYLIPPLRGILWKSLSSLAIDLNYARPPQGKQDDESWRLQEFGGFVLGAGVITLVVLNVLPVTVLVIWYAIAVIIFLMNSLRTLAAHAYRNPGDQLMSRSDEFLDSVNVPGIPFITALWAPVGLRFHATHHLFPSMPYHEIEKVHKALVAELPDNTAYLSASRKSLLDALVRLWNEASQAQSNEGRWRAGDQLS